jgi:hypothetical protein
LPNCGYHHNHRTNNPLSLSQRESQMSQVWTASSTVSFLPNPLLPVWLSLTSAPLLFRNSDSRSVHVIQPKLPQHDCPSFVSSGTLHHGKNTFTDVPGSSRTLNIKAQWYSETSVTIYQSARHQIPVVFNLQ